MEVMGGSGGSSFHDGDFIDEDGDGIDDRLE